MTINYQKKLLPIKKQWILNIITAGLCILLTTFMLACGGGSSSKKAVGASVEINGIALDLSKADDSSYINQQAEKLVALNKTELTATVSINGTVTVISIKKDDKGNWAAINLASVTETSSSENAGAAITLISALVQALNSPS